MAQPWVVYSKPCVAAIRAVEYLGRYSHRTAIGNGRILALDGDSIRFRYKDYRDHDRQKVMSLPAEEFIRRFLLHVLPKGLMRIRHFGFLANCCRARKLPLIRSAIAVEAQAARADAEAAATTETAPAGYPCPKCRGGRLRVIAELRPLRRESG